MKKIIQITLLMIALAFLCGMRGYAVKLNDKGQKMVSRLILHDFRSGKVCGEVVFSYDSNNKLRNVEMEGNYYYTSLQKKGKDITIGWYLNGKPHPVYQYYVITDHNGNIREINKDCVGIDGSISRENSVFSYKFCPDLSDSVIYSIDNWPLEVTPRGKIHPSTMINGNYIKEHYVSERVYENGNAQTQKGNYIDDRLIGESNFELLYNEETDDTNINMAALFGGFSCGNPIGLLMVTEWVKYKTKNLIIGVDNGKGKIIQQAEYSRDIDGNIIEMRQQLGENGFFVNIEYVD